MAAGVGQSTAAKILAGWAKEGTAAKETAAGPGRQGRAPERWFPADTDAPPGRRLGRRHHGRWFRERGRRGRRPGAAGGRPRSRRR